MSKMLRKKEIFTVITPIPGFIPRQLAIDILHSHSEVITLNPLVLEHKPIPAPRTAESDEFYSTWYEITERIQYIPGLGRMGSGTIKFNGCFHNMPWGLQTHIYAPMNVDLRNKYRIAGNQQGVEPPETPEIGLKALGAPADGLYLHEDIEIKCNVAVIGFVKGQLQKAGKEMVARIIKKAELLDAGVLHAMIENGKLKTVNPADRSNTIRSLGPSPVSLRHPPTPQMQSVTPQTPTVPYQIPRPMSCQPGAGGSRPGTAGSHATYPAYGHAYHSQPMELPASEPHVVPFAPVEMPGDFYHPQSSPRPPQPAPATPSHRSDRDSTYSAVSERSGFSPDPSQSGRWSTPVDHQSQAGSRPTSYASNGTGGYRSPVLDHKGFASELATHRETHEEHRDGVQRRNDQRIPQPSHYQPQDYAKAGHQQQAYPPYGQQGQHYNYTQ